MAEVFHISEAEALRDVKALFERVRSGERVSVEAAGRCTVILAPDLSRSEPGSAMPSGGGVKGRSVAEILRRLDAWESLHGVLVMEEGFSDDVQVAHERLNQPMDSSKWD